jgi:hypothetical protein
MKDFVKDARLRRHSVDVDDGASVAHLKLFLANMSLVRLPAGFVQNLVYQTRNLSDAGCVGGIGYSPDLSISLVTVCVRAAELQHRLQPSSSFNLRGQATRTRLQPLKQPMCLPQQHIALQPRWPIALGLLVSPRFLQPRQFRPLLQQRRYRCGRARVCAMRHRGLAGQARNERAKGSGARRVQCAKREMDG